LSEGYDPAFFKSLDEVEDRHFWFRARKRVVGSIVRDLTGRLSPGYHVLEVGCGNGGMLRLLQECSPGGTVAGMDLFAEGLRNARNRCTCPLVQADAALPPFGEQFQVVGMFDVLEHIERDVAALRDVRRMLAPGGAIVITVPAHMSLWSYFDEAAHHARRYSTWELATKLRTAGFKIEYLTQFMGAIYPLVWMGRRVKSLLGASKNAVVQTQQELRITPGLNALLDRSLAGEERMVRQRRTMTLGTSILAVGRKASAPPS
jgi:ubiquinone/menaquinone biosynthesis C-methylase UbiE